MYWHSAVRPALIAIGSMRMVSHSVGKPGRPTPAKVFDCALNSLKRANPTFMCRAAFFRPIMPLDTPADRASLPWVYCIPMIHFSMVL